MRSIMHHISGAMPANRGPAIVTRRSCVGDHADRARCARLWHGEVVRGSLHRGAKQMNRSILTVLAITAGFLASMLVAAPANAQATRTWVSGVGDDANPCSRTAPCKTIAGAISKTAVNGE